MGGPITVADKEEEKIGGFDKWDITSAYETLTRAREILNDKKKVAAVRIYAKEAEAAAAEVSKQLSLEKSTKEKLIKLFGKG